MFIARYWVLCCLLGIQVLLGGCDKTGRREVVIYTSVDEPISTPILRDFEKRSGIRVVVVNDAEAAKSVGLAERLIAEKDHPRADVWWSNEAFRTIDLAGQGVLAPYDSPSAQDIPERFKDGKHLWTGSGIRARVLAVSEGIPIGVPAPAGIEDLTKPAFKNKIAMARPTAGTTGSFVAALYVLWGRAKSDAYFRALHDNGIVLLGGNSVVADYVGQGQIWVGMTDNDDVSATQANDLKLRAVLPDQDSFGTLPLPGSVAMVADGHHPAEAKELIDYLLTAQVEGQLIAAHSAAWSVRDKSRTVKFMDVDFKQVSAAMREAVMRSTAILEGR
jgi:iron(III) transport system substrate-binding protein